MQSILDKIRRLKFAGLIFELWEKVSECGLTPEFRGIVRKREILLNRALAIAALYDLVVPTTVLLPLFVVAAYRGEYAVIRTGLVMIACFWTVGGISVGFLWLRHNGNRAFISLERSNFIEYSGYFLTLAMVSITGLMFPFNSLYYLYPLALVALIPVVGNRRPYDPWLKFGFFLLTIIVFLGILNWHNHHPPLMNLPLWTVSYLQWVMPPGAFALIFLVGSYIASESEKSEMALDAERKKNEDLHQQSEKLLLNILPGAIAEELKVSGKAEPQLYESATVLFTDFVGFTGIAEKLSPKELVGELDRCFSYFDSVAEKYGLEKLKTIGDSYMAAGGIPVANTTHPFDCALAALEIQSFMSQMREIKVNQNLPYWELRLGMHTGPLVAGVVGDKKFAYDVWGDTVNTASRLESSGEAGEINISRQLFEQIKFLFDCEFRGKVHAKNKGEIEMYFLRGLRPKYSVSGLGRVPNGDFKDLYARLKNGAKLVAK